MIITAILIIFFYVQLSKTISKNRKILSCAVLILYLAISFGDLCWLESVERVSFHFSDPSDYFMEVQGLSFNEVIHIESSNVFYFVINWIYSIVWKDPTFVSFLVKINNALLAICIYLLITKKLDSIKYIDYLLLFNPYTIMTMIRNVRDLYIILFISIILIGMGMVRDYKVNIFWTWFSIFLLSITRSVLLGPLFIIYWIKNRNKFSKTAQIFFFILLFSIIVVCFDSIVQIAGNQMVSSLVYVGETENTEMFMPLANGELSIGLLFPLFYRLFVGTISFLFTPHPYNFITKWLESMGETGSSGIYTGVDNLLISLGSVFNYLFVIPIVIAFWINYKSVNKYLYIFVLCYLILYVVSYLGVTDIRNRNTAIFFILIGVLFADKEIKLKPIYFILSICIFIGLMVVKV